MDDIVGLDALAVAASVDLVDRVRPADLARPTPCADWTLHGLITHMAAQHYGFAAAAAGDGDLARWRPRRLGGDPVADYRAAAETVLAAFAEDGVLDRQFPLPEVAAGALFPARQAVSFHFVDYVVHSWDVARSLGLEAQFAPDVLDAALQVARAVPGGEYRLAPGAAFAPVVTWPGDSPLDQVMALLGRSPDWKRPELEPERGRVLLVPPAIRPGPGSPRKGFLDKNSLVNIFFTSDRILVSGGAQHPARRARLGPGRDGRQPAERSGLP